MTTEEKTELFQQQILCGNPVYTWRFAPDGTLLSSNCPDEDIFHEAFELFGAKDRMCQYAREHTAPTFLGSPIGIEWVAVIHWEQERLLGMYVLGPSFTTEASLNGMRQALYQYEPLSSRPGWTQRLMQAVRQLSVVMRPLLVQYGLMLHYCVTGETLRSSDIGYYRYQELGNEVNTYQQPEKRDRFRTYQAERALLKMVREGDLNYKSALDNSSAVSSGVPVKGNDPLRQMKTSVIVFTSLCVREAITGGMSPEQAYQLGDQYIQSVESCSSSEKISAYNYAMYTDFIERVHKCRTNMEVSRQIRACCDYIEMHVEDELSIEELAGIIGYTKYYLSRKFKEEMGVSISEYIKAARIERAKLLLATTELSIQDIADMLHFCSRSYFSTVFLQMLGCTPTEFRQNGTQV